MPVQTIYTLEASNITVSGGEQLSGISQGDGSHLDGLTITLNSNDWEPVDYSDDDADFADNDNSQTLDAAITYDGVSYSAGRRVEAEYRIDVVDPDGNSYTLLAFNINEPGVTSYATVEGLAFVGGVGGFPPIGVPLTVTDSFEGPVFPFADLATPPCFTAGTLIRTPSGAQAIETLNVGDPVLTFDHGPQPIRWIGSQRYPGAYLRHNPAFRPYVIRADAFGPGRPARDLTLSPQHRILLQDWQIQLHMGEDAVIVPVKKLANDHTILADTGRKGVTYYHILFDAHELVWSNDLITESYFPGDATAPETEAEFAAIFPAFNAAGPAQLTVRQVVTDKRAAALLY